MFSSSKTNEVEEMKLALVKIATELGEFNKAANKALEETRRDMDKAFHHMERLEGLVDDIRHKLAQNERVAEVVTKLETKVDRLEISVASISTQIQHVSRREEDFTATRQRFQSKLTESIADTIVKLLFALLVAGATYAVITAGKDGAVPNNILLEPHSPQPTRN